MRIIESNKFLIIKMKKITNCFVIFTVIFALANFQAVTAQDADSTKNIIQALKLIHTPDPAFKPYHSPHMSAKQLADMGFEQVYKSTQVNFLMRDGKHLSAQKFSCNTNVTILLLHGVLSNSYMMNKMAGLLREATNAEIIALDFRGHGQSGGKAGDVDYIDQYADDLADVLTSIKKERPANKIIIAAHSMGGGIALRYAMKKNVPQANGYILFAPLLGQNSPTLPTAPVTNSDTSVEPFLKIQISRIIGLKMLNAAGNHNYDYLPVLFFNLPDDIPFKNYTYRANESMSPADYREGLKAVNAPLLVLVGSEDEAFTANAFKPAITNYSKGAVIIINGATHEGIRHNQEAMMAVKNWAKKFNLSGIIKP